MFFSNYKNIPPSAHTLICSDAFSSLTKVIIGHIFLIICIIAMTFMIISFSRKRMLFPIRERAPKLAIVQAISFGLITIIPYIAELMIALKVDWDAYEEDDIPFNRKLLKSLYMTTRVTCYFVFTFRYIFSLIKDSCDFHQLET